MLQPTILQGIESVLTLPGHVFSDGLEYSPSEKSFWDTHLASLVGKEKNSTLS